MNKKIILLFGLLVLFFWLWWPLVPPTINFVLPAGFKGPFFILEAPEGRVLVKSNGVVTVKISNSRILKVKSWKLLRAEHHETAEYENGSIIPIGLQAGPDPGDQAIAFRSIGSIQFNHYPEVLIYFIGTENEANQFDWQTFVSNSLQTESK